MNIKDQLEILEKAHVLASIPKPRTVEQFVVDMTSRGRTLSQILIVTLCTRWKGQEQKIKECYRARTI